jgi:hypothetical protein
LPGGFFVCPYIAGPANSRLVIRLKTLSVTKRVFPYKVSECVSPRPLASDFAL